jgi:RNA polymerase sigma factor (TIGR02999 family)
VQTAPPSSVTQLLVTAADGNRHAIDQLWSAVYDELHRLARAQLAHEGPACIIQTTSLVNEAYLRLVGSEPVAWANRRHFFAAAAEAMRRIRVERARERRRVKRGGGRPPGTLAEDPAMSGENLSELLVIDEAIGKLKQAAPRAAEVVMLRYFAGRSIDETAEMLGVSPRTVDADWCFAKAWLHRELTKGDTSGRR